ncbi:hypothetical protein STEG23_035336 [Scotinomys teguina]
MAKQDVENELLDYDDYEEPQAPQDSTPAPSKKGAKGSYVSIHSSGSRDFLLKPELLRVIVDCGFEHPSEQMEPINGQVSVLVLCHTRELAFQISKEYERFSKYMPSDKVSVFFGGLSIKKDEAVLQNCPHVWWGHQAGSWSVQRCMALAQLLVEHNFPATAIHRDMHQEERLARYQQFKDFQWRVPVATDLFGRGMDIEKVNIVFNYDMPEDSDTYLHRVACAGRFGTKGLAVTFVSDEKNAQILNDVQGWFEVNVAELPEQIDSSTYIA